MPNTGKKETHLHTLWSNILHEQHSSMACLQVPALSCWHDFSQQWTLIWNNELKVSFPPKADFALIIHHNNGQLTKIHVNSYWLESMEWFISRTTLSLVSSFTNWFIVCSNVAVIKVTKIIITKFHWTELEYSSGILPKTNKHIFLTTSKWLHIVINDILRKKWQ